ncbi:MAG TPA: RuBisCO large subunit C-terminal-like domain-containing protein [Thermoanaerobaculia bacterium]|jgi:ribulose-bisphosphate carboxylase large chain|nr:RuBisCO large subunit C-terminal-like domain-containing protein [Thermoanaerobaculia bacterium]
MSAPDPSSLLVRYRLALPNGESAKARALGLACEQTSELTPDLVPASAEPYLGRVLGVESIEPGVALATIALPAAAAWGDLAQLLVLLFGNASLQPGVRVEAVEWPADLLARFIGPAFGIDGLRELAGVRERRALLCGAVKPLGLSSAELAERAGALARGGADLIKDDHGIADPPSSPFAERIARCQEAVTRANQKTGGSTLYVPNLAGPAASLAGRIERLREIGCRAALVAPLVLGLETVREIAAGSGLALLAHPALAGAFFSPAHGIAPEILLGDLFRMAGCDAVIYPHEGGRFPFPAAWSGALAAHLRGPLGGLRPTFPVPAGGIAAGRVPELLREMGPDTIFLIGSALYGAPDLERATAEVASAIRGRTE